MSSYHAIMMPHFGAKPGAELAKYMGSYMKLVRHTKAVGVYPCLEKDCTYALYPTERDVLKAFDAFCRCWFEDVRRAGVIEVDDKLIRRVR